MADYRHAKTSLGECFVVHRMAVVDEHPSLLASLLPIWVEDEWTLLKALPPVARKSLWDGRLLVLEKEPEHRAADKRRTVHGSATP
jgi:hypothetical protein